jgi:hypothetical protein
LNPVYILESKPSPFIYILGHLLESNLSVYVTTNAWKLEHAGITHLLSVLNLEGQLYVGTKGVQSHMKIIAEDEDDEVSVKPLFTHDVEVADQN